MKSRSIRRPKAPPRKVVCSDTSCGCRPRALATAPCAPSCHWVGPIRSTLPLFQVAVKFIGSSGECDSSWLTYSRFITCWDAAITASGSPSFFSGSGLPLSAAARMPASMEALSMLPPGPSSHSIFSALRAWLARHQLLATTATPSGICTTSITPGMDLAALASKLLTLPPITGACSSAA